MIREIYYFFYYLLLIRSLTVQDPALLFSLILKKKFLVFTIQYVRLHKLFKCALSSSIFQRHEIKIIRIQSGNRRKKVKSFQISHFSLFWPFFMLKIRGVVPTFRG